MGARIGIMGTEQDNQQTMDESSDDQNDLANRTKGSLADRKTILLARWGWTMAMFSIWVPVLGFFLEYFKEEGDISNQIILKALDGLGRLEYPFPIFLALSMISLIFGAISESRILSRQSGEYDRKIVYRTLVIAGWATGINASFFLFSILAAGFIF